LLGGGFARAASLFSCVVLRVRRVPHLFSGTPVQKALVRERLRPGNEVFPTCFFQKGLETTSMTANRVPIEHVDFFLIVLSPSRVAAQLST
jgi:hypothetical protein